MDIEGIVSELKSERARIDEAIGALEGSSKGPHTGRRRRMSKEARRKISVQMKKNWLKRKRNKQE